MASITQAGSSSSSNRSVSRRRGITTSIIGLAVGLLLFTSPGVAQQPGVSDITHVQRNYPVGPPYSVTPSEETFEFRDLSGELRNKTTGTFTVASAGDLYFRLPRAQRMSPQLRDVLRNADIAVGNLEGGMTLYPADRAKDMVDMGFDLLAPGEDASVAGYEARAKYLLPLGIKVAGAGLTLDEARRPQFQEIPKGLVTLLHACPGNGLCGSAATNGSGVRPAIAGVNQLGLSVWNTVTQSQFNQLKAIRDSVLARRNEPDVLEASALPPNEPPGRMLFYDQKFMVADKPGDIHYELDPADEQAQVLAVRNAKEVSDFTVFHMHNHYNRYAFQHYSTDNNPADFMQPFLRKLIDNGLDMYVGSGNHNMQGIEIYKGRPIFYNQGNLGFDLLTTIDSPVNRGNLTGTESRERGYLASHWNDITGVAYIANTTYKDGRLVEILIYPVDIGLGQRPWSREHSPQTPTPQKARAILERLQKLSEPFGTTISIENNVGIIRVPPEATVDVSGDEIPGRRQPKSKD